MNLEEVQKLTLSPVSLGLIAFTVASLGLYIRSHSFSTASMGYSLPPGPPSEFLIGNLRQFPKDHISDGFSTWGRTYGDIVHAKIPGVRIVVINSYELAQELLSKRPATTAGRNNGFLFKELMRLGWTLPNIDPGSPHADQRKMLRRGIGPHRIVNHDPLIDKRAVALLLKLQAYEGNPAPLIMSEVGRLVTTVTYGEEMWKRMGEDLIAWNIEEMDYITASFFNFWIVDIFNFLRFVPSWIPGVQFKKMAKRARWLSNQIRFKPFAKAQDLYKSGELGPSIMTDILEEFGPSENARDALAILFLAGADTTSAAVNAFYHALFLFPEVAKKVHAEIDAVTEGLRLPGIKDRAKLPYTEAVWKESFRWNPFLMLGIPHVNDNDEVINGYLIPKGSNISPNNGFMLMDPRVWGDPLVFRPERFLESGGEALPSPQGITFGYGTRTCPGMYLADRSGFHLSATMAALFDILPLKGRSIPDPTTIEYSDKGLRLPQGFECRFLPRGEKAKHLLRTLALEI